MNILSVKTLGHFIHAAAKDIRKSQLKNLLMRSGLYDGAVPELETFVLRLSDSNAHDLLQRPLLIAHEEARSGNKDAHEALLRIVLLGVEELARYSDPGARLTDLQEALLSDGYELQWEPLNLMPDDHSRKCSLRPVDPDAIPISEEITALQAELHRRGYAEALNHYRLAVKHFTDQDHPSSNGQLRNMIESLVKHLAIDHVGYVDTGTASQGSRAIRSLYIPGAALRPSLASRCLSTTEAECCTEYGRFFIRTARTLACPTRTKHAFECNCAQRSRGSCSSISL